MRTGRTYRHRRGSGRSREGALKQCGGIRSIWGRPTTVANRRQVGHWEGDLIMGSQQRSAVATLVERKTRLTMLLPFPTDHTAQSVSDALITAFAPLPASLRRSLTWDQGNEMLQHARVEAATGMKIYFADPRSPWQRGTNEKRADLAAGQPLGVEGEHDLIDARCSAPRSCEEWSQAAAEVGRRPAHGHSFPGRGSIADAGTALTRIDASWRAKSAVPWPRGHWPDLASSTTAAASSSAVETRRACAGSR